ncbi:MAG: two component, sigma54 specific, transcriptional regulator, Fis family, partial [Polaromonas sp.]|nr:two component, sigma54 specific, transcriptional regulator, Fis family [Polaromonas sp.]
TLFLDEIGDLPLAMQSKLLRAIQERVVRPLGSSQEDAVDVRIVSATHRELGAEVDAGRFRQDLYYRLNVIVIAVPPLRERRDDLPELCEALLQRICSESGFGLPRLDAGLLAQLCGNPFHGNVRELENVLHRAVALSDGGELHLDLPPPGVSEPAAAAYAVVVPANLQDYLDARERDILCKVLEETRFNRTAAAAKLGLSLRQIRYRIARLNIPMADGDGLADLPEGPGDARDRA